MQPALPVGLHIKEYRRRMISNLRQGSLSMMYLWQNKRERSGKICITYRCLQSHEPTENRCLNFQSADSTLWHCVEKLPLFKHRTKSGVTLDVVSTA